jgi:hypothetical protein
MPGIMSTLEKLRPSAGDLRGNIINLKTLIRKNVNMSII